MSDADSLDCSAVILFICFLIWSRVFLCLLTTAFREVGALVVPVSKRGPRFRVQGTPTDADNGHRRAVLTEHDHGHDDEEELVEILHEILQLRRLRGWSAGHVGHLRVDGLPTSDRWVCLCRLGLSASLCLHGSFRLVTTRICRVYLLRPGRSFTSGCT